MRNNVYKIIALTDMVVATAGAIICPIWPMFICSTVLIVFATYFISLANEEAALVRLRVVKGGKRDE